ncbi:TetR/AcrR family transcriptional regulator [Pseudorhodoferax sp. Leaf265]|jgi:AcrR family transcriptional regulator|uniref:TetR/AcrR family transcriptional regulator n=1 Tax=Pseudorhodoferax sp. Leaf265 TaxID=1736315 RepID=UPI00070181B8|nr:TetR/AcrR family transcriptional regulator [Pseudorhodoferax sp. Leaf265]KQP15325.1 TetR family transcriptional regulator [Pseudorhodoferax sp. Leaf265]PZP93168.1 MAG: TetR/AcrR family transcriptional regulator [Variovorax paradoxus]PZQ03775.1 MAG: TetR/AcrR family transcriptional regulator [Variovorax paradoxus]
MRTSKVPLEKFELRRAELGEATLQTLAALGYARTSLREIAQNSAFSHGVLHYYFQDKTDLILCSVRQYKARCVTRYDAIVKDAQNAAALQQAFLATLGDTLRDEAMLHRLWYDLRAQAMFEAAFRADVAKIDKSLEKMVWNVVARLAALAGTQGPLPSPALAYAALDGVFQQALLRHLAGDRKAIATMQQETAALLQLLLPALAAAPAG